MDGKRSEERKRSKEYRKPTTLPLRTDSFLSPIFIHTAFSFTKNVSYARIELPFDLILPTENEASEQICILYNVNIYKYE